MVDVVYGDSNAPGLPPVNLPTLGNGARAPTRIVISTPSTPQVAATGDTWQPEPWQSPQSQPAAQAGATWQPEAWEPNQIPPPEISSGEAALRGAAHGLTFGFYPAIAGAAAGAKAALTGEGDFSTAYDQTRQQEQQAYEEAQKQHPYLTTAADIAGNLPTMLIPGIGASKAAMTAAEALPRIGQAVRTGLLAGGLFGAGEQTSKGGSALDIAEGAGGGALAGAALGGVFGSGVEGVSHVGRRVGSIVRGAKDEDAEAGRLLAGALKSDERQVRKVVRDKAALQAAQDAGLDVRLADFGGGNTKALTRAATNLSPEARDIIGEDVVIPRFQQQGSRVGRFIRSYFGGIESDVGQDAIKAEARRQNAPLYKAAYRAGARDMRSPMLDHLSSAPAVQDAIRAATERGANRAIAEGMGTFNPAERGMQFWDYVQRELRDAVSVAKRAGRFEEADALGSLHRQLLAEIDKINPAFARARGTAASFFKASDALEAGANFVHDVSISNRKAAQVIAKMNPAERELFKRGFAGELASRLERIGDNRSILNSIFVNNGPARQRILIALGPEDAGRLEALLRIEGIVDRTRRALGNSTTIQQGADASKFAGALALWEGAKSIGGALNPVYIIALPLLWAGRQTAKQVDERVFTRVAEMLMSEDPAVLNRGLQVAAKNPTVRTALRYASDLSARELVNLLGPSGVAAAALTIGKHMPGKEAPKEHPQDYYDNQGQQVAPP